MSLPCIHPNFAYLVLEPVIGRPILIKVLTTFDQLSHFAAPRWSQLSLQQELGHLFWRAKVAQPAY